MSINKINGESSGKEDEDLGCRVEGSYSALSRSWAE